VTVETVGRYRPSRVRLLERRRGRIVDAAVRLEEAHVAVQEARRTLDRGTPERRRVFHARAEARKSLFYHVRQFRLEDA
jgi:hypothetical protein